MPTTRGAGAGGDDPGEQADQINTLTAAVDTLKTDLAAQAKRADAAALAQSKAADRQAKIQAKAAEDAAKAVQDAAKDAQDREDRLRQEADTRSKALEDQMKANEDMMSRTSSTTTTSAGWRCQWSTTTAATGAGGSPSCSPTSPRDRCNWQAVEASKCQ